MPYFSRNISVLLDASKNGKVTLVVSYVVSNASWTPLYDVRAFNKDSTVQVWHHVILAKVFDGRELKPIFLLLYNTLKKQRPSSYAKIVVDLNFFVRLWFTTTKVWQAPIILGENICSKSTIKTMETSIGVVSFFCQLWEGICT